MARDRCERPHLAPDLRLELCFRRQVELVAAREDLLRLARAERVAHNGVVLVRAEDQPERRVVSRAAPLAIEVVDVELELAEIPMVELSDLEVDQDEALEHHVIEDEIDVEMVAIQREPLLPCARIAGSPPDARARGPTTGFVGPPTPPSSSATPPSRIGYAARSLFRGPPEAAPPQHAIRRQPSASDRTGRTAG